MRERHEPETDESDIGEEGRRLRKRAGRVKKRCVNEEKKVGLGRSQGVSHGNRSNFHNRKEVGLGGGEAKVVGEKVGGGGKKKKGENYPSSQSAFKGREGEKGGPGKAQGRNNKRSVV